MYIQVVFGKDGHFLHVEEKVIKSLAVFEIIRCFEFIPMDTHYVKSSMDRHLCTFRDQNDIQALYLAFFILRTPRA